MIKPLLFNLVFLLMMAAFSFDKLIDLKPKYPKPRIVGTEKVKGVPELEPPRAKGAPPKLLQIPSGCKNIAEGKEVSSSDNNPTAGDLDMITDGENNADEYVQLSKGLQWVQIDLEVSKKLYAAHVWHYFSQPCVYYDIIIQISDDENFIEGVKTVFNNDHDNSSGLGKGDRKNYIEEHYGKSFSLKGIKGQFIRFYSKGNSVNSANHYIEVQVYGK